MNDDKRPPGAELVEEIHHGLDVRQLLYLTTEDERYDGRTLVVRGRQMLAFGSASYLGLELDPRIRASAIDAIQRFGVQFSSSRAYLSNSLYAEVEDLVASIFGTRPIIVPSTSVGHITALPLIAESQDAIVLDRRVHQSVQNAARLASAQGAHLTKVPHNDLDALEDSLRLLSGKHRRVWYAADGLYSMNGDWAPVEDLGQLLERYPAMHLYVDDAHAMSWRGTNGRGHTLEALGGHPRVVVATSLNKSFGCNGGVLVIHDEKMKSRIRYCGGPVTFSGPLGPPVLGAIVASARIHLSSEISSLQMKLRSKIALFDRLADQAKLPRINPPGVPIQFIATGSEQTNKVLTEQLFTDGYYVNAAQFPAVALGRAGVRLSINLHHTDDDIADIVGALARRWPEAMEQTKHSGEMAPDDDSETIAA